jgi:hypothetical protein
MFWGEPASDQWRDELPTEVAQPHLAAEAGRDSSLKCCLQKKTGGFEPPALIPEIGCEDQS